LRITGAPDEGDGGSKAAGWPAFVPVKTFSTSRLPPEQRYVAWRDRDWPHNERVYRTEPCEPFDTSWETVLLGPVQFVYAEITGMRWERRVESIRASSFDPIIVNMMIEGHAHGDCDGRAFDETAGSFHFHDLGRPSVHISTASRTYSVIVPRQVAEQWLAPLADLHGLVIEPPAADLVMAQAAAVHRMLHRLTETTAERLGRVFLELLAAIVTDRRQQAPLPCKVALLRRRAEGEIARRIGGEAITAEALRRALGVSRATLFEAFAGDGGMQKYAMGVRLDRARGALAELDRDEPIGDIAYRFGFSDASHLSRAFRARFGMSPRDYRHLAEADQNGTRSSKS
jgi:AraC-like DNA-binding protein